MFLNHLLSASNHLNSSLRTCPPSGSSECYLSAQFVCSPPSRLDLSRRHSSALLAKSFNDPDDFHSRWLRMQRVEGGGGGSQHHHLRPLAFRCKTTEMLNLVTLEDDNIAKKKKTNSDKSNKQKNTPITAKLQANLSCDLASSENLTTSSEDGSGEDASDNDDDDDDDDKTHYEQVLISIGESLFHNFESDWSLTDVTDEEDNGTDSKHGPNGKEEDCYEEYLEEDLGDRNRRDRLLQKVSMQEVIVLSPICIVLFCIVANLELAIDSFRFQSCHRPHSHMLARVGSRQDSIGQREPEEQPQVSTVFVSSQQRHGRLPRSSRHALAHHSHPIQECANPPGWIAQRRTQTHHLDRCLLRTRIHELLDQSATFS